MSNVVKCAESIRFSIVIPAYNYASVLTRAVDSALAQPGDDYEVIVVNDGSTDNTDEVMRDYAEQADNPALRYHLQQNGGASAARNQGVELSRGSFLIFLDADDELVAGSLDDIRSVAEQYPKAGLLVGGHITVHEDGSEKAHRVKPLEHSRKQNFFNYLAKKISMANGAVAMNRAVFNRIRYPEGLAQAEDIPVFGQAFANFDCYAVAAPIAKIYRHEGSRRSDINLARKAGFQVVDRLFDPSVLPADCMGYRNNFYVRKCLSMFRQFYKAGDKREAKKYYHRALIRRPFTALKLSYFSKYLRLWFKQ